MLKLNLLMLNVPTQEENLLSPRLCLLGLYIWVQATRSVRKEVQLLFFLYLPLG